MTEYQLYQLDEVDQVMGQIATEMLGSVKKREKLLDLALCIREGLNNALLYGRVDTEHPVILEISWNNKECHFVIYDNGDGVSEAQSNAEPDMLSESGRGLMIMQELLRELSFEKGVIRATMDLEQ